MKGQVCKICHIDQGEDVDDIHLNSAMHRYNWILYEWKEHKDRLMKDRHGIEISVSLVAQNDLKGKFKHVKNGEYVLQASPEEFYGDVIVKGKILEFSCVVKNTRQDVVFITTAGILIDYKLYDMKQPENNVSNIFQLGSGNSYKATVQFKIDTHCVSTYKIPVYFCVQFEKDKHSSTYVKSIVVSVTNDILLKSIEEDKSPFTGQEWEKHIQLIHPEGGKRIQEEYYVIPPRYMHCLKGALKETEKNTEILREIKKKLQPENVTVRNYKDFFHILLWLEEIKLVFMLGHYNMGKVNLVQNGNMFTLTVPGLAEKRPSVIQGDYIDIKVTETQVAYRGIVENVNTEDIDIKSLDPRLSKIIRKNPETEVDIRFVLGRIHLERSHQGVDEVLRNKLVPDLFPDEKLADVYVEETIQLTDKDFFNATVARNKEQRTAVLKILNRSSGNAPYIVYGPPGTGKTVTIVEAILQLKRKSTKKILVCAPANAACNMLTEKLQPFCNEAELVRIISDTADMDQVSASIKEYVHTNVTPDQLPRHRIVITTLILAGKYTGRFHPDVVFIDEAAQPCEPEACCAIGLLKKGKQIVLAGDPFQLGPNVRSRVALNYGLQISLLERLIESDLYKKDNPNFITMLKENYRSHKMILMLPNKLFYNGKLEACSYFANNDPISNVNIYVNTVEKNRKKLVLNGKPVEFCAVLAKEQREGKSPSFFNTKEIEMVLRYIKELTALNLDNGKKVKPCEIGVVTPYIRQVYKLKEILHSSTNLLEVEVGTTETFQGREKRVIIVTTVRSQEDMLLYDKVYDLGFVKHDKRFNVALTRAMSKLIVIGNPQVLQQDSKWKEYIDFCRKNGSYYGAHVMPRNEETLKKLSQKVQEVNKLDTQYNNDNGKKSK